jgi:23S rRNA (guanosine2251-2'-O)-methyltransferase
MENYIYGRKVVFEFLKENPDKLELIYIEKKNQSNIPEMFKFKTKVVTKDELDKVSDFQNHQGFVAKINNFAYTNFKDFDFAQAKLVIILDHIEDPGNLGAIIRSAVCFGADLIVIPKDRSARVNGTVSKMSMGAVHKIPITIVPNLSVAIKQLKDNGFWIYGSSLEANNKLSNYQFAEQKGIVIGNEGKGISPIIAKNCDDLFKIDMQGDHDSLNASVSAGIIMYEATKE